MRHFMDIKFHTHTQSTFKTAYMYTYIACKLRNKRMTQSRSAGVAVIIAFTFALTIFIDCNVTHMDLS